MLLGNDKNSVWIEAKLRVKILHSGGSEDDVHSVWIIEAELHVKIFHSEGCENDEHSVWIEAKLHVKIRHSGERQRKQEQGNNNQGIGLKLYLR